MPRKVFTAGEILTAADVNTNLMDQSVMVFAGTAARGSAIPSPSEGMVTYREDDNIVEVFDGSAFVGVGKILQVVRATDGTNRTTTSTSYADANISVTITPKKSTSAIIVLWSGQFGHTVTTGFVSPSITDASNVALSGAEAGFIGSSSTTDFSLMTTIIGYSTPATTSPVTYKGRFRIISGGTGNVFNASQTGQLYAIEVSA